MIETYQPSGRIGALTFPVWAIALLAMLVIMFVYQLLLNWIPIIYVNFLLTVGVGFAGAFLMSISMRTGPCRNKLLAGLLGLVFAALAIGGKHWIQYESAITAGAKELAEMEDIEAETIVDLKKRLRTLISFSNYMKSRMDQGWEIGRGGGAPIKGIFVILIWLIEAGIIGCLSISSGFAAAGQPFNETYSKWADEEEVVAEIPVDQAAVEKVRNGRLIDDLVDVPNPASDDTNEYLVYKVNSIAGEELEDAYLTVQHNVVTVNKKGESETKENPLWNYAVLKIPDRKRLMENVARLAAQ